MPDVISMPPAGEHRVLGVGEGEAAPAALPAIDDLALRPQFVAWQSQPVAGRPKQTKIPINPHTGGKASVSEPRTWGSREQATARAEADGLAGIGYVLTPDDDLTGIDLDGCIDADGTLQAWAREVIDLAETYAEVSPSRRGIHLYARGKIGAAIKSNAAGVEVYDRGRYLTVTGQHWAGTPEDIRAAPATLDALRARVAAFSSRPDPNPSADRPGLSTAVPAARASGAGGDQFFRTVNQYALANLGAWVPSIFPLARFQQGTGAWRIASRDLGRDLEEDLSIAPTGITDFGVADIGDRREGRRSAIDIVIEHGGAGDAPAAALWLCERMGIPPASLGWRDGGGLNHGGAALAALIMSGDGRTAHDPETGEVHSVANAEDSAGGSLETAFGDLLLPDPAAMSQGTVRAITDWILDTGRRPNAPLAMAAALVTVGGVCSRHVVGPTGSATHLFVACLGSSGVGKDHPLKAPGRILSAAGLGALVRTGKLMSSGALENLIAAHPAVVATIDEMGESLFGKIMHKRASTHEAGITAGLRELWSMLPGSFFDTAERAGGSSRRVESPALMLFGMSTPGEFFRPLDAGSAVNGFLNRFLLIEAGPRADDRDAPVSLFDPVPDSLVDRLTAILPAGGQLPGSQVLFATDSPAAADILQVPYATAGARALFANLEERCRSYRPGDSIVGDDDESPLIARTAEMSVRLATIHAMGRDGRAARVGEFDLRWGATIALRSAHAMAAGLERHSGGGEHADRVREVEAFLRREGGGGALVPRRAVVRAFHRKYEIRQIDATLSGLKDAGRIEATALATGGRPSEGYRVRAKSAALGRRIGGRDESCDVRTYGKGHLPLSSFRRRFRP